MQLDSESALSDPLSVLGSLSARLCKDLDLLLKLLLGLNADIMAVTAHTGLVCQTKHASTAVALSGKQQRVHKQHRLTNIYLIFGT